MQSFCDCDKGSFHIEMAKVSSRPGRSLLQMEDGIGLLTLAPVTSQVRHDNGAPKETISSRFVVLRPPSLNASFRRRQKHFGGQVGATRRRGGSSFGLNPGFRGENENGSPLTLGLASHAWHE